MRNLTLQQRAEAWNAKFPQLPPLVVCQRESRPFLYGAWFVSGGRHSTFYGAYHQNYLERITGLFSDATSVVHLFAGSLPPGPYVRVGIDPTGLGKTADIIGNAEALSSFLKIRPDVVYADPPYSNDEAEEDYQIALCNGPKVVDEVGIVLQPGGFLIWLDQRLPVFSNDRLRLVGLISYIRSTGNRFRCICIFQKPANVK